jgi:hypothetical protein
MGKRGPKPKGKVKLEWSSQFAYAIGLIASDGNLSPDGRHITFTSKDIDLINLFQKCLGIQMLIGKKANGLIEEKKYYRVQFGDVLFYEFLVRIGLIPNKSKIIGVIAIPDEFFFDFLLGSFDGDGYTYSYFDSRYKSSFMFYTAFTSASREHVGWLQREINSKLAIKGHVTTSADKTIFQLKYAKAESLPLLQKLYDNKNIPGLPRKRLKIKEMLRIIGESL